MPRTYSEWAEFQAEAESALLLLWLHHGSMEMLGYEVTLCALFHPPLPPLMGAIEIPWVGQDFCVSRPAAN